MIMSCDRRKYLNRNVRMHILEFKLSCGWRIRCENSRRAFAFGDVNIRYNADKFQFNNKNQQSFCLSLHFASKLNNVIIIYFCCRLAVPYYKMRWQVICLAICFVAGIRSQSIDQLIADIYPAPGTDSTSGSPPGPINLTPTNTGSSGNSGGDGCSCVPYYLCSNNSIITDGFGIIDIRYLFSNQQL